VATLRDAARGLAPVRVVMCASDEERFTAVVDELAALARSAPLGLAGPGATAGAAEAAGAERITASPTEAALAIVLGASERVAGA
jgi:hypothetical protein